MTGLTKHRDKITIIPVIDWCAVSLWTDQDRNLKLAELGTWITTDRQISTLAFALESLDSMAPTFKKNSVLIVDPAVESRDGNYVIVALDCVHPTVKKLVYNGKTVCLANVNYPSQFIKLEVNHKIFGPIIELREPIAKVK